MKTILIVMLMLTNMNFPYEDIYVISKPTFETVYECQQFVYANDTKLAATASANFNGRPVHSFYCLDKDVVEELTKRRKTRASKFYNNLN